MTRLEATKARNDFATVINQVAFGNNRVVIHRHGKDVAALIPMDELALLERIEDALDIEEAKRALADPKNKKRIPWQKVKKQLGL